jgi:hypothetical protein
MSQRICVCVCVCAKNNGLLCCQTQLLLQLLIVFEGTLSNLFLCVSQAQRDIIIKFVCVCVYCWFASQWLLFCLTWLKWTSILKLSGTSPYWKQNHNSCLSYYMHAGDSGHSICFPTTGYEILHHNRTSHRLYGWALSGKHFIFID